MSKVYLVLSLVAAMLAGCAQSYVRPAGPNVAELQISPQISTFVYYEDGERCTDVRRFDGVESPFARPDRSIVLPAGKRVAINFVQTPGLAACSIVLSFQLEPAQKYRLVTELKADKCHAALVNVTSGSARPAEETQVRQMELSLAGGCKARRG